MPDYTYSDGNGHTIEVNHRMLYTTGVLCAICNADMHRVPQPVRINWNGVPPSKGDMVPAVRDLANNADRRRDEVDRKWETYQQAQQ